MPEKIIAERNKKIEVIKKILLMITSFEVVRPEESLTANGIETLRRGRQDPDHKHSLVLLKWPSKQCGPSLIDAGEIYATFMEVYGCSNEKCNYLGFVRYRSNY